MTLETLVLDPPMEASDYWSHCAREWHNVALGAHEAGAPEVEAFFDELADSADFMGHVLGYDWRHGQ